LPYLLPRALTKSRDLAFVLAYGDLSHLEICTVLGERIEKQERQLTEITLTTMKDDKGGYEKLAGIHKVAIPISDLPDFLSQLDDGFNFSVSLYGSGQASEEEYDEAASEILATVRESGLRKANLVRPGTGTEVMAKEVASRQIIDFVLIDLGEKRWLGVTIFVPNAQEFVQRSNERPVVSADIAISSRLAKLLVNLAGVEKGQTVLDPFCGSGTILSEALLAGANCAGVDRDAGRIENTKRNLAWIVKTHNLTGRHYDLKVGDSTRPGTLTETVDAVISEPIFLPKIDHALDIDKAKKLIRNASRLYSDALYSISDAVKKGGKVVIVTPALRTSADREVSVLLENVEEARLRPFRPASGDFDYPVKISNEKTRWVRRLVYVFERA